MNLSSPQSLADFQRMFPDEAACVAYLSALRWPDGYRCPCGVWHPDYKQHIHVTRVEAAARRSR